jgi:Na+/H+-dicarboxylate symporter
LDNIVEQYLYLGLLDGLLAWVFYYWVFNTEFFGKLSWWVLFGLIFSLLNYLGVQNVITSMSNAGELSPQPDNIDLLISNLFFFIVPFLFFTILSSIKVFRGHRLKRIPF